VALVTFASHSAHADISGPYTADANTLHLWHLDETTVPATGSSALSLTALGGGATLGNASFSGFGTALSTFDSGPNVATGANTDAYLAPATLVNEAGDNITWSFSETATGAFTFEALIRLDFDPAVSQPTRNSPMMILSGDQDDTGGGSRSFQFRYLPVGVSASIGGAPSAPLASPALDFIRIGGGGGAILLPTTGPDVPVQGAWFHVAVTYNGNAAESGNLKYYWTRVAPTANAANLIASLTLANDLTAGAIDFAIGQIGRNPSQLNFVGLIDEVRISNVARGPSAFIFFADADNDDLADAWEVLHFKLSAEDPVADLATILARQNGTDDPDADGSNNEAEETGGSDPTNTAIRPYDLDGDGLVDAWELQHFTNTTSQTGSGNADGDTFTNAQEQTAGSNPTLTVSTPNDTDGDGTPNSAETLVPYATDANTLHLWDLDGSAAPVADRVYGPSNLPMEGLGNGATLSNTSFSGFGGALNTNLGYNTNTGAYLAAKPAAVGAADTVLSPWAATDGAFTFEALVRLDFDPLAVLTGNPPRMQIMAGDEDFAPGEASRIFQFAIAPPGSQGNTGTTPRISFINIGQGQTLEAQLPDTGTHAPVQGQWFHVAVSYDGIEATAGNLKFYWTRLDSGATSANLAGSAQMSADLRATPTDFAIGNETRDQQTGAFQGLIDQVRVSSIARASTGFIFGGADPDSDDDLLPDAWEAANFGNLDQTATGDFENDGTNNRAEYLLGLNPKDGSSLFKATVSGSTIQWHGVAGLSFVVQRSTTLAAGSWSDVSTQTGVNGLNSYTDPAPPAGKAFYRVLLVMP
jgi:hypothetical protein